MKIMRSNLKKGDITIAVENADDLWFLSQIIEKRDLIKGKTIRKISGGRGKEERASSATRRTVVITLQVEQIEFHQYSTSLRVLGTITEAPDDVPKAHHTFSFEEGTVATIIKGKWYNYQLKRLKEASVQEKGKTIICCFDREEAVFAEITRQGYKILAEIKGQVEKKAQKSETRNFYQEIIALLKDYDKRFSPESIILASPSFWKEELQKELTDEKLEKKLILANCSSVQGGINEILRRPELREALKKERIAKEAAIVEEIFSEISRQGAVAYGFAEVEKAVFGGAVKGLALTDSLIMRARQDESFGKLEQVMKQTDSMGGEVFIVNGQNDPGKKLDALGGIAATLRYKINY